MADLLSGRLHELSLDPGSNGRGRRSEKLMRKTWMDQVHDSQDNRASAELVRAVGPFLVLLTVVGTLIWLIRILLENRRWGRIFAM